MSIPEADLLGHPLTDVEKEVARAYEGLRALVSRPDLPPAVQAGAAHALAALWQVMNDLNLPCEELDCL